MDEDKPTPEELGALITAITHKMREIADSLDGIPLSDPAMTPDLMLDVVEIAGEMPRIEARVNDALRSMGQPPLS